MAGTTVFAGRSVRMHVSLIGSNVRIVPSNRPPSARIGGNNDPWPNILNGLSALYLFPFAFSRDSKNHRRLKGPQWRRKKF
jgi:hypothetical protein